MDTIAEYLIPFKGLENGIHNYRFQVKSEFFKKFENSRVQNGNYLIDLIFDKRDQMMILDFSFAGKFRASCDRCLTDIDINNSGEDRVIVKIKSTQTIEENEEVIYLHDDDHKIDIAPIIFDMIQLHLPLSNLRDCERDEYKYCNHDVLDKIDFDEDVKSEDENGNWDILKDLNLDST